jgi:hypothetical protein
VSCAIHCKRRDLWIRAWYDLPLFPADAPCTHLANCLVTRRRN